MQRLVKRNLGLEQSNALGWKHGFVQAVAVPADLLVIVMVRNALDWTRSMHAKPWHTTPDMQRLAFSDFIRAPWDSIVDRPDYFGLPKGDVALGTPLQQDRDPMTGQRFSNLVAMRRAKIASELGLLERGLNVAVIRCEDATKTPEQTIRKLADTFDLVGPDSFKGITRRLGSRFRPSIPERPATPPVIPPQDREFIVKWTDREQESRLEYRY